MIGEATEGAKAIPGAIVGYTAHKLLQDGLRVPTYGNRDFIALMVGKILSRPVTAYLFSSLPNDFQDALEVLNTLFNREQVIVESQRGEQPQDY